MNVTEDTLRRIMREEINQALDSKLDSRFGNFEKRMDSKLDSRFEDFESRANARFKDFESKMDKQFSNFQSKINLDLARFFGETHRYLDKRFNKFEKKFDKKHNALQNSMAGISKRVDDDNIERAAMSHQLDRHETNLGELARHTGVTLSSP
ncbi:MAG TPA: hypothetical protein VFH99_00425 [Candidatus Saccharimonadales bacterium]|nr:hypothetical protein [Candidatus Saccharimonadales bacterium]